MKITDWAKAPLAREPIVLFPTKLDEVISDDHPARVYAELTQGYDWSEWEATYHGSLGQPPIHPRILATLWLYGIRRGIRSSRKLEYMASHCLDFMWLAEGHRPDHTTFSEFRLQFKILTEPQRRQLQESRQRGPGGPGGRGPGGPGPNDRPPQARPERSPN